MGFDLNGIKPTAEVGVYFRNNCWWWRPLAEYVLSACDDLFEDGETKYWQSNDGQIVSISTAIKIAERLQAMINSGHVTRYADRYIKEQEDTPQMECKCCNGTGWRDDLEPEWREACNGCNACHGTGKVDQPTIRYPFSTENVAEFAAFCKDSGGFEIW